MIHKRMTFTWLAAVAACATLAACGGGKDDLKASADSLSHDSTTAMAGAGATTAPVAAPSNLSDANILALVGMANTGEVAEGRSAQGKASNADVKAFAKQMVNDHGAMQKDVDQLAKKNNLTPAAPAFADSLKKESKASADSLGKLKGAAFDKAYIAHEVAEHQKTLDDLRQWQSAAQNADLRNALGGAIQKVQGHLEKAQQIQTKLGT